jgi:predicted GH43/DUF377 family glycosyl hydrolase
VIGPSVCANRGVIRSQSTLTPGTALRSVCAFRPGQPDAERGDAHATRTTFQCRAVVRIGNCGSQLELDEGWLLLTHGVGPVRKYPIGAVLLDKNHPSKVVARSREPLVRPEQSEREGYVPNVVYTCGAMRHNNQIVMPYTVSDTFSNFATIEISALMSTLQG